MVKINVTDRAGVQQEYEVRPGEPLMYILRDTLGLPVEGICGGCASCGTCHVYVDPAWIDRLDPIRGNEEDMLESLRHYKADSSRLTCQITLVPELDGLTFTLAPEE